MWILKLNIYQLQLCSLQYSVCTHQKDMQDHIIEGKGEIGVFLELMFLEPWNLEFTGKPGVLDEIPSLCLCPSYSTYTYLSFTKPVFQLLFFRLLSRAHVLRILNSWKNNPALSRKEAHISGNSNTGTFQIKEIICLKHLYSKEIRMKYPQGFDLH